MKDKNRGLRIGLKILCTIEALVLILLAGGTFYIHHMLGKINRVDQASMSVEEAQKENEQYKSTEPTVDFTGPTLSGEDVDWGGDVDTEIGVTEQIVNIMLIGQDRRPGEPRSRSDTMILCTINTKTKTLTMTSFMRDLYVQIPGYGNNKMNAAYAWGGMELLNKTMEKNFGIHVDGNVEVDFTQFAQIVDLLGGVEMELRGDEAKWINETAGYGSLTKGVQRLDGTQAMLYSRVRSLDGDGDFSRTNRQRKVLNSMVGEMRGSSLSELLNLLNEVLPMVTTDMTNTEIIGYATDMFPILSGINIVSQRVPASGMYYGAMIDGMACLVADMNKTRNMLQETLG